jgi:hypothetical protein
MRALHVGDEPAPEVEGLRVWIVDTEHADTVDGGTYVFDECPAAPVLWPFHALMEQVLCRPRPLPSRRRRSDDRHIAGGRRRKDCNYLQKGRGHGAPGGVAASRVVRDNSQR